MPQPTGWDPLSYGALLRTLRILAFAHKEVFRRGWLWAHGPHPTKENPNAAVGVLLPALIKALPKAQLQRHPWGAAQRGHSCIFKELKVALSMPSLASPARASFCWEQGWARLGERRPRNSDPNASVSRTRRKWLLPWEESIGWTLAQGAFSLSPSIGIAFYPLEPTSWVWPRGSRQLSSENHKD